MEFRHQRSALKYSSSSDNINVTMEISIPGKGIGLGSTVMLRGPPSGFGEIIYSADTILPLEAQERAPLGSEPAYFYR